MAFIVKCSNEVASDASVELDVQKIKTNAVDDESALKRLDLFAL